MHLSQISYAEGKKAPTPCTGGGAFRVVRSTGTPTDDSWLEGLRPTEGVASHSSSGAALGRGCVGGASLIEQRACVYGQYTTRRSEAKPR